MRRFLWIRVCFLFFIRVSLLTVIIESIGLMKGFRLILPPSVVSEFLFNITIFIRGTVSNKIPEIL